MASTDWCDVIEQAANLDFRRVTFIGGEPTLHRDLPVLTKHALSYGLRVSIFSNLVRLTRAAWELAALPGVRLETSYYSESAEEHDAITGVRGSHARTTSAIKEALRRGIDVHVALVSVIRGQSLERTRESLQKSGVSVSGTYQVRAIGRAGRAGHEDDVGEFCGRCGAHTLSVDSRGFAYPCVFARRLVVGNIHTASLATILSGHALSVARRRVRESTWTADPDTGELQPTGRCPP